MGEGFLLVLFLFCRQSGVWPCGGSMKASSDKGASGCSYGCCKYLAEQWVESTVSSSVLVQWFSSVDLLWPGAD